MKKYLVIKHFENICSSHIYESLNTKQDAIAMRDILQREESDSNIEYLVFELTC